MTKKIRSKAASFVWVGVNTNIIELHTPHIKELSKDVAAHINDIIKAP